MTITNFDGSKGNLAKLRAFLFLPRNAWVLTSTSALWSVGSAMANPYQTLYFAALGASYFDIGIFVAYGTIVTIFALLVGGYIADTWGRRRVIIIFSCVSAASAAAYGAINSPYLIVIPLTIASMASVYTPAFNAVMFDSIEPGDRIRGFSVFSAINNIPSFFAPTIGGLLMAHYGILEGVRIAYFSSAVFGAVAISFRQKFLGETWVVKKVEQAGEDKGTRKSFLSYIKDSFVSGIDATRKSNTLVKKLLLYITLAGVGTGLTAPYASIYVVGVLHVNPIDYSIVVDLAGFTTVCLLLGVVFLIKKMGAKNGVLVASISAPVSNMMFSQAKTMDELLEWGVTGAVGTAIQTPSLSTMQAEAIEQENRGKILAMFSILPALVSVPSQVAAGLMYQSIAPVVPFVVAVIPFAAGAIVLFSIKGREESEVDTEQAEN
jgi:DHA1 family tetracycline resistance protein-like MFS transporter